MPQRKRTEKNPSDAKHMLQNLSKHWDMKTELARIYFPAAPFFQLTSNMTGIVVAMLRLLRELGEF